MYLHDSVTPSFWEVHKLLVTNSIYSSVSFIDLQNSKTSKFKLKAFQINDLLNGKTSKLKLKALSNSFSV